MQQIIGRGHRHSYYRHSYYNIKYTKFNTVLLPILIGIVIGSYLSTYSYIIKSMQ